ncbi:hypothetical protein [Actinomadura vinacea]|uniref:hypothetical protein n=1 Tax=Actinomadura vinacea TaxID=115336 RepID=UPI0031DF21D3
MAAADQEDCPKSTYCANVLEEYACDIVAWDQDAAYAPLRAAAAYAAIGVGERTRDWAEYVARLLSYREEPRPVNRARAEQMATDLLTTPRLGELLRTTGGLSVRLTPKAQHWECRWGDSVSKYLYINRRTGRFRTGRLSDVDLAALV